MSDAEDRVMIRAAIDYRGLSSGLGSGVYLGSLSIARIYGVLGLKYGEAGFEARLDLATRKQLDAMLGLCKSVINYMQDHPTKICPCCGSIVEDK